MTNAPTARRGFWAQLWAFLNPHAVSPTQEQCEMELTQALSDLGTETKKARRMADRAKRIDKARTRRTELRKRLREENPFNVADMARREADRRRQA